METGINTGNSRSSTAWFYKWRFFLFNKGWKIDGGLAGGLMVRAFQDGRTYLKTLRIHESAWCVQEQYIMEHGTKFHEFTSKYIYF